MEEKKGLIKTKKQMFTVIGVFALVMFLGTVTYAFFNYTRTGSANTIKTGRIAFDATQGNDTVTLSDLFPITVGPNDVITPSTPGVGSLTIHVTGDTTYAEGIEYLVKAVNVTETNGSSLPISVVITYEANGQGNTIGTPNDNYFNVRGGSTSYYKVLSADTISNNGDLIVGYIAPGQTGIDGNITIMAYLDASNIAITDTHPQGTVRNVLATGYTSAACETALTGVTDASTYCASVAALQEAIDNEDLTDEEIRLLVVAGIVEEYTDGTTSEWVNQRTVFTTEEWNALQANGVSFQVKVEANEGTWVRDPGAIDSCPGCKFMYSTSEYQYGGANNANATAVSTLSGITNDYRTLNSNYFLGFTETNGKIDRAFVCGIKGENPNQGTVFCIEGSLDGSTSTANNAFLNEIYGSYNNGIGCDNYGCHGAIVARSDSNTTYVGAGGVSGCGAYSAGVFYCY